MKSIILIGSLLCLLSCQSQNKTEVKNTKNETPAKKEESRQLSGFERHEIDYLKTPFSGVFTSKGKKEGLFPQKTTGVSTKPIVNAARQFVESLSTEQKQNTIFPIDDEEWRKWCNVDNGIYRRQGISIKEMTATQRNKADDLLRKSLSLKGLELAKNIMKTDQTLKEVNNGDSAFDEELYYFTVMGNPSNTEPWGWQLDGHHLVINYFVLGDQIVMTPTFMGAEPVITKTGKYKGNTLFQDEQNLGLKFMQSLSLEQQKEVTISKEKNRNNIQAEAFSDNNTVDFEGLRVSKMSENQKEKLLSLINQYISNMKEEHAKVKMTDIKKHLDKTYFAWIGKTDENAVFYYRIHSPVILIEFDHQAPVGVRGNGRQPTRNHIHTIVRTPNGNDYGKDYLRQHLEQHHH